MSELPAYRWAHTEKVLASCCTVREVVVKRIDDEVHAEGNITFCDYAEDCIGMDDWVANRYGSGWIIEPSTPFFTDPATGQPCFTAARDINAAMAKCIASHITHHLKTGDHEIIVPVYDGKTEQYSGRCCCEDVEGFDQSSHPSLWREIMEGYAHPRYCFECRCGAHWWFDVNREFFCRVPDPAAWEDVTTHNGVFTRLIVEKEDEGIFQLMTLRREEGIIPLSLDGF